MNVVKDGITTGATNTMVFRRFSSHSAI